MSNHPGKKLDKIIEITPDLDSVNVIGKVSDLQLMESMGTSQNKILVSRFTLHDDTGCVKAQLKGVDVLKNLNNGDILEIRNGRIDVVDNKILLCNDIWSKISNSASRDFSDVNTGVNISGIEYHLVAK